ncbi:hypothetical protein [Mucilaginibacter sp.]|uniref:hypothetical protein n=1 Tax=Mucilaginibacter sp. TaxID=1882438 RepID=UPI0025E2CAA7|nr:hypothetical protein [Mucilaginibacter sp.]
MTFQCVLKRAAILLVFMLAYSLKGFSQTDSLRFYASQLDSIYNTWVSNPDTTLKTDSVITAFLHVNPTSKIKGAGTLQGFALTYNTPEINWYHDLARVIDKDSVGFLIKVRIPRKIYDQHKMLTCWAVWWGREMQVVKYGGINMRIKLMLQSQPQRASVYLVPHRIWKSKFENTPWKEHIESLSDYMVDSDQTNTSVTIDETVYTVVFKLGNKFLIRTHYTRPMDTEPTQKVTADFQNE